ncbi:hypothetical protein D9758_000742 [Tetrapyrgos nigripes]|uniref:Uncharacterized protein n=1 Tax=Tetrapyrgos nigripes TaxID=182062 RepID=A0A8H5LY69_9AGAR|nr:hypothetical protein D9758_000742 [Tetrapyrgos nigripes]
MASRAPYRTRNTAPVFSHPYKRSPLYPKHASTDRDRYSRRILEPIYEYSPSPAPARNHFRASARNPFLDFDADQDQDWDDHDQSDDERGHPVFPWEDEKTLISDLMNDYEDESEDEQLTSLADSIQGSFAMHHKELTEDAADTFVPAANRVKHVHQVLKDKIDFTYGTGVLEFDDACKNQEAATINEFDELRNAYRDTRLRIKDLFKELQEAYARRDQLWVDLDKALDEDVNPTLGTLKNLPSKMERAITALDKQSKQLVKDNGNNGKALKGFLSKLA